MAYLHDLSYELGVHRPTLSLKEEGVPREAILELLVKGADGYRHSVDSLLQVALRTAQATLQKTHVGREQIDVLLFGTNSLNSPEFRQDFGHALLTGLGLSHAYVQSVGFQNCGDSVPILRTAHALVESGTARNVLVLIADDVTAAKVPRILKNSYLHSDGACACLVTATPRGFRIGNSAVLHVPASDRGAADLYDLEGNLASLLERAAQSAASFGGAAEAPAFVVTHNMNRLYNQRVADVFGVPRDRVFGNFPLGHCLASDVLVNLCRLGREHFLEQGQRGILVVPTRRSVGVLGLTYHAPEAPAPSRTLEPAVLESQA